MSLGTFIGKNVINGNDYDENISLAEKSSDQDSKENYYEKAIDVYPDKIGGYIGLVNTYKSDNSFDENEEARFKKIINTNLAMVKKADDYGSLAFEIGKLYWYYYDYGNTTDNTTRSKSAAQWFKDAKSSLEKGTDEQKMAEVYEAIGNFNNTVTINIEEADDKGMYKPYFKNLSQLIKMMKNSKEQEKVKLELYNLTISAIENYARKFKNDGISQEKLQSLYDDVVKEVNKIQTTIDDNTDKIYLLKSEILGKISECQVSITNAYRPSMEEE
jgi:tetratricopeptide (TPR) repeat protein